MSFTFGLSPFVLILLVLAAAGLTYWTYYRTTPELPSGRKMLLGGIRFVVLFIVLALLFRPILRLVVKDERDPVLAVLVDDSQSLNITNDGGDSASVDRSLSIKNDLNQLPVERSRLGGEARIYRFSSDVQPVGRGMRGWTDSLRFTGQRTNISRALEQVREDLKDQNLKGVLLISDGQYNTGRSPLYVAERYPVPIYTTVIGDTTSQRDLHIRGVVTNEIAYRGTEQPVQVAVRSVDFGGEAVTVSLVRNGEVLSTSQVTLPEGTVEVPVELTYVPEEAGMQRITVTVSRLPGELTFQNNSESFNVRVLERKKKILLLGAAPDPDFSAIRQILEENEDMEVTPFVQKSPGAFYQGPLPADLSSFDVVVLAGYPGQVADIGVLQRIARMAEAGTPLIFFMGRSTDPLLLDGALSDYLPVSVESARNSFVEAMMVPTPEGLREPILAIPDLPDRAWSRLPPLAYNESRWRPAPDARVLATLAIRGVSLDDPLLVVRRRAGHRSAALLGAGTWRWKNVPEDLEDVSNLWPGLVNNLIQWVSAGEDDRPVRVRPAHDVFEGGEPVRLIGQVYDESLNAVSDAEIDVEITAPDSTRYPYRMTAEGNGRYLLDAGTLPEGTYHYTASAQKNGEVLGTDSGVFAVGALTLEYRETRANATLLRQLAGRSGGAFLTSSEFSKLPEILSANGSFNTVVVEEERETELWRLYPFLVAIILLLTVEWFLRKRSGMI